MRFDIDTIVRWFEEYAYRLPLETFVFVGSFVEEILSPIPSFVVMIPAGAAAQVQGASWWYLLPLAIFAALGRLLASMILYGVADKAEDWLLGKGRKFFGVTHKQLEGYGQRVSGTSRDFAALFLLNAVPVFPTSLLSLSCGFIKVRFKLFVGATFLGSAVNAVIYMSVGYAGIQAAVEFQDLQAVLQIIFALAAVSLVGVFIYRRKKRGR